MQNSKNSLTIPTFSLAIVSLMTFLVGFIGKGCLDSKEISEYKKN